MAQISYNEVTTRGDGDYNVGFFSLKNDNDEAIVRILCDQLSDLTILTVHPVTVGASSFPNRNVNCLRTPHDPLDKCPLCNSGEKVKQRVFIKMLQYDPNTKQSQAVVWDRPAGTYVPKLKSYIDNYGPLSEIMCKIIRHGSGLDTTYDIIPNINPSVFTKEDYPIDYSSFEDFNVLGSMVMDKTSEEITEFMRTGSFPDKQTTFNTNITSTPVDQNTGNMAPRPIPNGYEQPFDTGGPAPMDQGSIQRPTRYY